MLTPSVNKALTWLLTQLKAARSCPRCAAVINIHVPHLPSVLYKTFSTVQISADTFYFLLHWDWSYWTRTRFLATCCVFQALQPWQLLHPQLSPNLSKSLTSKRGFQSLPPILSAASDMGLLHLFCSITFSTPLSLAPLLFTVYPLDNSSDAQLCEWYPRTWRSIPPPLRVTECS